MVLLFAAFLAAAAMLSHSANAFQTSIRPATHCRFSTNGAQSRILSCFPEDAEFRGTLRARNAEKATEGNTKTIWKAARDKAAVLSSRLDTLQAAGLRNNPSTNPVLQSGIGFLGHSGLLTASTVLVFVAKAFWKTIQQSRGKEEQEEEVGVMDRCPWPFIFSHDPIQGLKDPPTWIVVTWVALWRILIMWKRV